VTVAPEDKLKGETLATSVPEPVADAFCSLKAITTAAAPAGDEVTEMVTGEEVLAAYGPLALNVAVIVCEPTDKDAVLKVAAPPAVSACVPSKLVPSKKDTPPNGAPAVEEPWAENVNTVPATAELAEAVREMEVMLAVTVTGTTAEVLGEKYAAG
jgi:hypothetical protein